MLMFPTSVHRRTETILCRSPGSWIITSLFLPGGFPVDDKVLKRHSPITVAGPCGIHTRFPLSFQSEEHRTHIQLQFYCRIIFYARQAGHGKKIEKLEKTNRPSYIHQTFFIIQSGHSIMCQQGHTFRLRLRYKHPVKRIVMLLYIFLLFQ